MANVIKHKRGSGSDPVASDLVVGEVAIRTDVGKLFTKMDNGSVAEIAGGGSDIAINTLSSSSGTGGGSATFNGSAYRFTLSQPPSVSAQQLLVSINGVIQKPVAGTGQPSEGFSVDGTDIILGDAPATGSDFFILTFKSLGVSEPADNSVTSAKIVDGAIVNADINASAAIAGTKISPNFGTQAISTTGTGSTLGRLRISHVNPFIELVDTNNDSDFSIRASSGNFVIRDDTNAASRLTINSSGTVDVAGNLDVGAGLDVTGAITGTGNLTIDTNTLHVDSTNNRVGIGTTSPNRTFTVQSNGGQMSINDTDNTNGGIFCNAGNFAFYARGNSNLGDGSVGGVFSVQTHTAGGSTAERLRIDSSGNVGIGTTSPTELLDVEGTIECLNELRSKTGNDLKLNAGSANRDVFLQVNDSTLMTVQGSTGNVGIGTTSPASPIHSHLASSDANRIRVTNSTTGATASDGFIVGLTSAEEGIVWNYENSDMLFGTNNTERMRIDSSGRVMIGTTSTSGISGSADDIIIGSIGDSTSRGITFATTTDGTIRWADAGDNAMGRIQYLNNTDVMTFHTSNAPRLRLDSDGMKFGSDTAAANALDDYEEGTFTPNFNTTANNLTFNGGSRSNASLYLTRQGSYVKIGKRVWFQISMSTTGLTSVGGSDFIALDGLPFTAENDSNRPRFVMACQAGRFNGFVPLFLVLNKGTTLCQLRESFDVQRTINYFDTGGSGNRNVIEAFGSYEIA